jgi:hypothetical protein
MVDIEALDIIADALSGFGVHHERHAAIGIARQLEEAGYSLTTVTADEVIEALARR